MWHSTSCSVGGQGVRQNRVAQWAQQPELVSQSVAKVGFASVLLAQEVRNGLCWWLGGGRKRLGAGAMGSCR